MFFLVAVFGTFLMFFTSLIQRRQPIRAWLEKTVPYGLRLVLFAVMFIVIVEYGYGAGGTAGGFMYEQF